MKRLILLALWALPLTAQYPPDTQWRKIRTQHFEVVFPREIEPDAQRLAAALETMYRPLSESLGASLPRQTTVLLPNQGVTRGSGGFVSLFPRMAVVQSTPTQSFYGTNDWVTTMSVQEGRHLVQVAKMKHGYGKVLYALFGEAGTAAILGWTLPDWWISGDARAAETTLLRGAIGNYASSEMVTRAFLMSDQKYSYMKAMHGSFRDAVPNQAELGSFLVNHVDRTSGPEAWNKIMERAAQNSWNPFAVSRAMKKETGRSAEANFSETMSQLDETWKAKSAGIVFSRPEVLNSAAKRVFTSYYQPAMQKDGSVVAQKIGLDTYPVEIVRVTPGGREQTLARIPQPMTAGNRTAVVNGKIVWDEYVPDIRWLRGYSEILIRDSGEGRTRRLTHKTRFTNPALSPDGSRVAVVEFLPDRKSSLVILDAATGAEVRRLPSPGNDLIYTPAWSEDGRRLAIVTQASNGRALTVLDLDPGEFRDVIPHRDEEISSPVFFRDYVLYKSSRDGVVNIFAADLASGQCYQVTNSRFGADFPSISPDGRKLLYSDYTAKGYNVAELALDPSTWTRVDFRGPSSTAYQPKSHDYSAEISSGDYAARRYRPGFHLFDVHSWGPNAFGSEVGFAAYSNDKMGLLDSQASVFYNTDEGAPGFQTGFHYNRFFPVLDFGFADRGRRLTYTDHTDHFTERTETAGFHVPLNLSRGFYNSGVTVGTALENIGLHAGGLLPLNSGIGIWHIRQRAARDLAPKFAQILRFGYSQTLHSDRYTTNRLYADGRFALPGLFSHHALVLDAGYQRDIGNYYLGRAIAFPRGYTAITGPNLQRYSADYALPLFYPDWSLGQLIYIRRVSANAFYDYGRVGDRLYRSTGLEAIFDVNIFHWPGFRVGLRDSYRIDYGNARINPFIAYSW
jgi:hypothetical protein